MNEEEIQKLKAEFKGLVDEEAKVWKQYIDAKPWSMTTDQGHIGEINRLDAALTDLDEKKREIARKMGWEIRHQS